MADAEDNLRIGVEYEGAAAIRQFADDMQKPGEAIQRMTEALVKAGVPAKVMELRGGALAKAMIAGIEAQRGGVSAAINSLMDPGAFGRAVTSYADLPRNWTRIAEETANVTSRLYARLRNEATKNSFGMPNGASWVDPTRAMREGMLKADVATGKLSRSVAELQTRQAALARVATPLQSELRTLERANVSEETKKLLAQASVTSLAQPTAALMPTYTRPPLPPPTTDYGQQIARALAQPPTRAEVASGPDWPKRRFYEVGREFGLTAVDMRQFQRDQKELIAAAQAEIAARKEAVAAIRAEQRSSYNTIHAGRSIQLPRSDVAWSMADPDRLAEARADQTAAFGSYATNSPSVVRRLERDARQQANAAQSFWTRASAGRTAFRDVTMAFEGEENLAAMRAAKDAETARKAKEREDAAAERARRQEERIRFAADAEDRRIAARKARIDQNEAYGSYATNLAATRRMGGRVSGTFREEFMDAFTGAGRAGGVGEMLGQTARVSLSYGIAFRALGLLQQGLQAAIAETLAYEDALTNLNVVTERTRAENQGLANALEEVAASAGFQPSVGLELGSRAVGLYGVAQADQATQERTIETATAVATRMARVSGADPLLVQTQLAGALRSLGWGAERATEMEDTISFISRQTGQAPTELLGAVANISTLGTQAGFSPQMLAALVAQIGTTTGQNPEATAGQFRQLLSRSAPEVAREAGQIIGRDLAGLNLEQIFAAVSREDLNANQLNQFASLFGKGGSQQVATILTQQYGTVEGLAQGATSADGFGREAFGRVMDSINGKLGEFGGALADFGVTLMQTGILDWFAALVMGATDLLQAGTKVLDWFNELPRPLRSVALALAEVYAVSVLMNRFAPGRAALARMGIEQGAGVLQNLSNVNRMTSFQRGGMFRYSADEQIYRMENGQRGGLTGLRPAAYAGAAAALGLATAAISTAVDVSNESQKALSEARQAVIGAGDPEALREAAAVARDRAAALSENTIGTLAVGDVADLLPSLFGSWFGGSRAATELEKIAQKAESDAAEAEAAEAARREAQGGQVFSDFTFDGLNTTMSELSDRGFSARERLDMLNEAMGRFAQLTQDAEGVIANILPEQRQFVGNKIGQEATKALGIAKGFVAADRDKFANSGGLFNMGRGYVMNPYNDEFRALDMSTEEEADLQEKISERMQEMLSSLPRTGNIDQGALDKIKKEALASLRELITPEQWRALAVSGTNDIVEAAFQRSVDSVLEAYSNADVQKNPASYIQVAGAEAQAVRDMTSSIAGGAEGANQAYLADLERAKAEAEAAIAQRGTPATEEEINRLRDLNVAIVIAKRSIMEDAIARARAVSGLAIAGLRGDATGARLGLQLAGVRQEMDLLAAQRGQIETAAGLTDAERQAALQQNELAGIAAQTTEAGLREQQRQAAVDRQIARVGIGRRTDDTVGRAQDALEQAGIRLRNATRGEVGFYEAQRTYADAQQAYAAAVVARDNAIDASNFAGNRSQIIKAELDLRTSQRNLALATEGTEAYFSALAAVREAQAGLSAAYVAQNDRNRRLGSDLTDPVAQARLDVERAREQLQYDIATGQGPDVIAQAQLDLRSAQNSEEAAAFNQRISDLQTAEDLGRISHSAYMSYLQSEHDRLAAIAGRTRQQQEQLDQVDKLMKSAAEQLNGQFNIGDIDLPSVYQVRRAIASGAPTQVSDYSNSNNVVNVNGASFEQIVEWLIQYMGPGANLVTAPSGRRI